MKKVPNLYSFATKELAQDATIAYILAWADPHYFDSHPRLNSLGTALLQALLASAADVKGFTSVKEVTCIEIETQVDRIDVLARVNDEKGNGHVLVIEDKVGTHEHSNQIERYVETARTNYPGTDGRTGIPENHQRVTAGSSFKRAMRPVSARRFPRSAAWVL